MSKEKKTEPELKEQKVTEKDACEIIELLTGDIDVLARAFNIIEEVCREKEDIQLPLDLNPPKANLH